MSYAPRSNGTMKNATGSEHAMATTSRRNFLRHAARGLALAALVAGGAFLALRNGARPECPPRTACAACLHRDACNRNPDDPQPRETR